MDRMKKFFIYALLVVLFFIFSQIMIHIAINTTYEYKQFNLKSDISAKIELKATSINGIVNGKIEKEEFEKIQDKFIKMEFYSKNNVLLGTKYISVGNLDTKDIFEFEIRFNYSKVNRMDISVVDEISDDVPEKDKISDPEMGFTMTITALLLLYFL